MLSQDEKLREEFNEIFNKNHKVEEFDTPEEFYDYKRTAKTYFFEGVKASRRVSQ